MGRYYVGSRPDPQTKDADGNVRRYTRTTLYSLHDILAHVNGRTIARELTTSDVSKRNLARWQDKWDAAGTEFTDGTIVMAYTVQGFGGSDVTPADPVEVEYALLTPE